MWMILLLALLASFPPMATDMYLPAIPTMQSQWNESLAIINLTLVAFFISFSICLLVYGPVSDRFGRKPPLLTGILIYVLACISCAASGNALMLIISRICQGIGAAAASTLALAIIRDYYDDRGREKILAYIGILVPLVPMLAPIMGSWVLIWLNWRWIFIFQALIGILAMLGVFKLPETLKNPYKIPVYLMITRYTKLFQNFRYSLLNFLMALGLCPAFAFIAISSDLYINRFGLSENAFSLFFGFNALALMTGSSSCAFLLKHFHRNLLLKTGFAGVLLGGILMAVINHNGPWHFALPMALIAFSMGFSRPLCLNLVLSEIDQDIGSASSLMMFSAFIFGSAAMWMISLDWPDKITALSMISITTGAVILTSLFFILKRRGPLEK